MQHVALLYGSQTGTAQEVAERIARDARRQRLFTNATTTLTLASMDEYDFIHRLPEASCAVFVCATTGQGTNPDSMRRFWRFLCRRALPADCLARLRFAVLGLGDSSYVKFNFAAKKLHRRLVQLGAQPLLDVALADDQDAYGVDSTLEQWLTSLWPLIEKIAPKPPNVDVVPPFVLPPSRAATIFLNRETRQLDPSLNSPSAPALLHLQQQRSYYETASDEAILRLAENALQTTDRASERATGGISVTVRENARLTAAGHFQDVRSIVFDTQEQSTLPDYTPGDVLYLQPHNTPENAELVADMMGWSLDDTFVAVPSGMDHGSPFISNLPRPCSVRDLLTKYLDIASVPRRYFFEVLSYFAMDIRERDKLREFASMEGQEERYSYCNRVRRTSVETLRDFPSVHRQVPFAYLFELFAPIRPRAFSLSSSQAAHARSLHICMAVVNYKTKLSEPRRGLCSNWAAELPPQTTLLLSLGRGTMTLPEDPRTPIVMIGPGTGVAPFRSFVTHRVSTNAPGRNLLFFGSRNAAGDFLYRDEWQSLVAAGKIELFTAFSRDQDAKYYVQHRMLEEDASAAIWSALSDGGVIYISGSAQQMPQDVRAALQQIVVAQTGQSEADAEAYLAQLERVNRLQVETWS
ncbi:NADPH-dependent FMN and FAD containing oxidoreductase [Capsaspora owczarzaki ATCC 30864]|uniref:NADPH-dependent diflavin oxidoreductase 1 n=1 Tax=Capsaspora owczarzaki (strain ATCC 30864) TaxID=595528 RepID=A0A0D2VIC9_CAPO3|nr:NADPH-dependent FMN and FAD containing oxidoreductase [Capsaspora owczarzaki ATCC 30864]KJE89717.1 NADPH-dependent FMN and FAD containing oxidoreductase [Capsaspora owczarzaki ATCC 30864]|eukprot:XP_004366019.2 NADPH-dependent FMN and FAD containing oxidoreductase [Capsaspora owczarzaki ATCC 30864]